MTPGYFWHLLWNRLTLRKCKGCADEAFHTHHLTWLGHKYWPRVWESR